MARSAAGGMRCMEDRGRDMPLARDCSVGLPFQTASWEAWAGDFARVCEAHVAIAAAALLP
eukprot:CAMPEP_0170315208 /NCGR_PEP_ID=MMETSP0116_2-20130129/58195_1 /TAXON_ID=400756 /ORGANISM="Durinskia baltica, Strain CSIRO CS-38" /LENGTH=60 /DNA_ID=CAMNT_0010567693 /DNA_START=139 /DNA_END=318 /DNA_ORIENTATION=+